VTGEAKFSPPNATLHVWGKRNESRLWNTNNYFSETSRWRHQWECVL